MRLIWQSKIVSGSTSCADDDFSQFANRTLACRFDARNAARKSPSSASGFNALSSVRLVTHLSPMASEIRLANLGFACSNHRRGVTPLVLLLKRSGYISARSLTVVVRKSSEWTAATPFVLCEPTIARLAMRIL